MSTHNVDALQGVTDTEKVRLPPKTAYGGVDKFLGATAGTDTAYIISFTTNVVPAALVDGLEINVRFHVACGTAPTINVGATGAIKLKKGADTDLASSDVGTNTVATLVYDSSLDSAAGAWQVIDLF